MKKSWIYRQKSVKGWWVGWYEGGKKKAKARPERPVPEPVLRQAVDLLPVADRV